MEKLSRRAFLRAAAGAPTSISSVLVRAQPAQAAAAAAAIAALPGAEITWRGEDGGKLVVVLESDSDAATWERLQEIMAVPGVVTADLTYAYNEEYHHG